MPEVKIKILIESYEDEDFFPPVVRYSLIDVFGSKHEFIDKEPIVTDKEIGKDVFFPFEEWLPAEIVKEWVDENGTVLTEVNTSKPWAVRSTEGECKFVIKRDALFDGKA